MTLTISLSPEAEAKLRQRAAAEGKDPVVYASRIVEQAVSRPSLDELQRPAARPIGNLGQPDKDPGETVDELAKQWMNERPRGADLDEMTSTPAYQQIIQMGDPAIRPLLKRLRHNPDHWFSALHQITHENPVPPESEGKMIEMSAAWLKWGKERGYIGELD